MPTSTSRSVRGPSSAITALEVDDAGLRVTGHGDFPVDVQFDGRRVFSFWLERDTKRRGDGRWMPWPPVLSRYLDGAVTIALVDPADGRELISADVRLGGGEGDIRIEDAQGNPMGLDKSMRLTRLFGSRDPEHMVPLLDAMDTVLGALEEAGLEPFIAYGTLLGAVRDQNFIGHDSDADLGYVSTYGHPVDAMLESFRVQRRVQEMGFQVHRYSGLAFKVVVRESDGSPRGLDVFGGFLRETDTSDSMLYLMGEVGHRFQREWLYPRSTATLAGRTYPVPAEPDHLLEAMYGPTWRVPDPAYKFTTPKATQRRLNGWFRGTRVGFDARWERVRARSEPKRDRVSSLAKELVNDLPDDATVIDIGCGNGRDLNFLARRGIPGIGLDYFPAGFKRAAARAEREELPVEYGFLNLNELRSVMPTAADLARRPGPHELVARHLLDATDRYGRSYFFRLAKVVSRASGRLHLQFQIRPTPTSRQLALTPITEERMRELVDEAGGTVERVTTLDEHEDGVFDVEPSTDGPTICRMVVSWTR